jgi:putative lipoprotein
VVRFEERASLPAGTLHVSVEEVTRADRAARVVASTTQPLSPGGSPPRVPFAIDVPAVEPGARYVVRVLVDLDGDGAISPGDYVSTRAHPVLTGGAPDHLEIPVQMV